MNLYLLFEVSKVRSTFFTAYRESRYYSTLPQPSAPIDKMSKDHVEGVEQVEAAFATDADEKITSSAYVAEAPGDSSAPKSRAERSLLLKADGLILPLATLVFFVAYLVCGPLRAVNNANPR